MTNTNKMYAINKQKQAELDSLTGQVTRAEYQVEQLTAIVNSLTTKQATYSGQLSTAETDRATAQSNLDLVKQVVAGIKEMVRKSHTVRAQTKDSNVSVQSAAAQLAEMVNKLIYSIELLDKLTLLLNKKQETRVVISADLITTISTANSDANNALALTFTALNSCFAAMSNGSESVNITTLEYIQSLQLYGLITGNTGPVNDLVNDTNDLEAKTKAYEDALFKLDEAKNLISYDVSLTDYSDKASQKRIMDGLTAAKKVAKESFDLAKNDRQSAIDKLKGATDTNANELAENVSRTQAAAIDKDTYLQDLVKLIEAYVSYVYLRGKYETAEQKFQESVNALNVTFAQFSQNPPKGNSLYKLIDEANTKAKAFYDYSQLLLGKVNQELTQAQAGLVSAQANLASLRAGLAAATAAALAA